MCIDGNSAALSVRYLNAQLTALWKNAVDCVKYAEHHGHHIHGVDFNSSEYDKHKYQRALSQFHFVGRQRSSAAVHKEDLFFHASFARPRLEFICNHEAALYLTIEKGHLNKAFSKTHSTGAKGRIDRAHNVAIDKLEVAFRMRFSQSAIEGQDSRIGNGKGYLVQLMILDFDSAQLVLFRPDLAHDIKDAVSFYLHKYLAFLSDAGHNCLLNLPDFDDDAYSLVIDYSLTSKALEEELCTDVLVHGTSVEVINDQLRAAWLNVAALAAPPADKLKVCLAEIKSQWLPHADGHFHIRFAPPTVKALCPHEVIVYYNIEEIVFYENAELTVVKETYKGWSIALIVTVVEEKTEDGVITFRLDMETARFCRHLSAFGETTDVVVAYFERTVEFVMTVYIDIIIEYELTIIFQNDPFPVVPPVLEDPHVCPGPLEPPTPRVEIGIKETTLYGFDEVLAVSEETINALFASLWISAKRSSHVDILYRWSVKDTFGATFEQLRVQLLSDGRALVWITISSGQMTVNGHQTSLNGWRLAFEVKLKQVEHADLRVEKTWFTRFKEAIFGKTEEETTAIQHVVLDLDSAELVYDLCVFEDMFDAGPTLAIAKIRAIKTHLATYLVALARTGYHVVHSTPLYRGRGLGAVSFQVVSRTTVTVRTVRHVHESPVLLIVGMKHGQPLPRVVLEWSAMWVVRGSGTVCLAREMFLQKALLEPLAVVNAKTTIVPRFPKEHEPEWEVYLTTWDQHRHRQNRDCSWTLVQGSNALTSNFLEYEWEYGDEWSYERHGTLEVHGSYNVACCTKNRLLIPTTYRSGGMDIVMLGESTLSIKGYNKEQQWSKTTWSATIHVSTEWNGLHVHLADVVRPKFEETKTVGHVMTSKDTTTLLKDHMPGMIDLGAVMTQLKTTLEGGWKGACAGLRTYNLYSPVFNVHGDLIVQLRLYDPSAKPPPTPAHPVIEAPKSPRMRGQPRPLGPAAARPAVGKKRSSIFVKIKETVHDAFRGDEPPKKEKGRTAPVSPQDEKSKKDKARTPSMKSFDSSTTVAAHVHGSNGHADGQANGNAGNGQALKIEPTILTPQTVLTL